MDLSFLRRWWPVAAVAVLLALASLTAAHSSLEIGRVDPSVDDVPGLTDYSTATPPSPSPPPQPTEVARADQTHVPGWIVTAVMALVVVVVLVVVGLVLRALIRDLLRRGGPALPSQAPRPPAQRTARDVVAALDAGLVDLDDDGADPRAAVIACWVRLERAAASAGVSRRVGDTPTDLVTRLLGGEAAAGPVVVSAEVLAAFAQVYREARYATHTVDERMRVQARSALERLRAELTAGSLP